MVFKHLSPSWTICWVHASILLNRINNFSLSSWWSISGYSLKTKVRQCEYFKQRAEERQTQCWIFKSNFSMVKILNFFAKLLILTRLKTFPILIFIKSKSNSPISTLSYIFCRPDGRYPLLYSVISWMFYWY